MPREGPTLPPGDAGRGPGGEPPPPDARRALVEHPNSIARLDLAEELTARGWSVSTCPGPSEGTPCPLVEGLPCDHVDGADLIVNGLRSVDQTAVSAAQRLVAPEVPIVVLCDDATWSALDETVPGLRRAPAVPTTDPLPGGS